MKTLADIQQLFESKIRPLLLPLEERRKAFVNKMCLAASGVILITSAIFVLGRYLAPTDTGDGSGTSVFEMAAMLSIFMGGGALFFMWRSFLKPFRQEYKEHVIEKMIKFINPEFSYACDRYIPYETYWATKLYEKGCDRYKGDDWISGRIGETDFELSEIHSEYKTVSHGKHGRREHWHTIFRGIFFIADFHKHFSGSTVVLPDVAEKTLGIAGQMFQSWNMTRGELIKLEDPEFEREFVVYGSDQVEARYILSTSMMPRILELRRNAGSDIRICFRDSKLYLMITRTGNLFEPPVWNSVLDFGKIAGFYRELALAFSIVEDLNLNTRIWTKS